MSRAPSGDRPNNSLGEMCRVRDVRSGVEDVHDDQRALDLLTVLVQPTAMQSRATIGQAKGIIMARQGCSADEAFQVLVRASSKTNIRLRELAHRLVEQTGRDAQAP